MSKQLDWLAEEVLDICPKTVRHGQAPRSSNFSKGSNNLELKGMLSCSYSDIRLIGIRFQSYRDVHTSPIS